MCACGFGWCLVGLGVLGWCWVLCRVRVEFGWVKGGVWVGERGVWVVLGWVRSGVWVD